MTPTGVGVNPSDSSLTREGYRHDPDGGVHGPDEVVHDPGRVARDPDGITQRSRAGCAWFCRNQDPGALAAYPDGFAV